jgi:hypothetical protein
MMILSKAGHAKPRVARRATFIWRARIPDQASLVDIHPGLVSGKARVTAAVRLETWSRA